MNHEAINNARRKINEVLKKDEERVVVGWRPGLENKREEGERWVDVEGKEWEMKNGFKQRVTKLQDAKTPWFCPSCGNVMNHRFDTKFWYKTGKCFDCNIKLQTQMVLDGTWEEFEKDTMRKNYLASIKDAIIELEHAYKHISAPEIVHADDTKILMIEKWHVDIEEVKKDMLEEINTLKEYLRQAEEHYESIRNSQSDATNT